MKQIPVSLLTLVAGVVVTLISLWAGNHYQFLLPEQASEQAPLVDNLFRAMVIIGTALFIVVEGAILIFLIWFRRRPGDASDGSPLEGNVPLEIFWTFIPAIIVIGLGVYSVEVYQEMGGFGPGHHQMQMAQSPQARLVSEGEMPRSGPKRAFGIGVASDEDEAPPADVVVNVSGMQYAWIFEYPETGTVAGELHIPVGADVQLNLSANDVIHSFWVPQFRLKQDAIPGQDTQLRFRATQVGTYPVICAELCGAYHGSMRTTVAVEEPEQYQQWLQENTFAQADPNTTIAARPQGSGFAVALTEQLQVQPDDLDQIRSASGS